MTAHPYGIILICDVSEEAYIRELVAQAEEDDHWDLVEALAQDEQLDREYCRLVYGDGDEEEDNA